MFSRYRLRKLAVRGFLIGVLLAPVALNAQEKPEEQTPSIKQSEWATPKTPTPDNKAPKGPAEQKTKTIEPPPAAPVQSKRATEPTGDAKYQAAEQREKADLKAQESMADAAIELIKVSWWQFGAGVIGLATLFLTLKYTRDTAKAVSETAERQLRAYVGVVSIDTTKPFMDEFTVHIKNVGQTPAHKMTFWHAWETGTSVDFVENTEPSSAGPKRDLFPGVDLGIEIPINFRDDAIRNEVLNRRTPFYLWGGIRYVDTFGKVQKTIFRCMLPIGDGVDTSSHTLISCAEGNDAT